MVFAKFVSCGHYLPKKVLSNKDLESILETSDEWIQSRTGIEQRHIAENEETTAYMGYRACLEAINNAQILAENIDMIVVATTTPDHVFPSVASKIQAELGACHAFVFDVQAVCSGFVYALAVANNFIQSGQAKNALVVGSDRMSSIVNWKDRSTAVLFGDGAGAYFLQASEDKGVLSTHLYSDGSFYKDLYVENKDIDAEFGIKMIGQNVFKHGVKKMGQSVTDALTFNQLTIDDVDCFIPHQANKRIILSIAELFNIPLDKMIITVDKQANTSAATIPLATYSAIQSKRLSAGDLFVITALGGGFSWGSAVLRYL